MSNEIQVYPDGVWHKWNDETESPAPVDDYIYKIVNGKYTVIGKTSRSAIHDMIVLNDNPFYNGDIEIPEEVIGSNGIPVLSDEHTYKVIDHLLYAIKGNYAVAWYKDDTNNWFTTSPSFNSREYITSAPVV